MTYQDELPISRTAHVMIDEELAYCHNLGSWYHVPRRSMVMYLAERISYFKEQRSGDVAGWNNCI